MPTITQLLEDLTSGDEPRAENAAVQFVSLGDAGFQALIPLSSASDEDTRWWALRAISEFRRPEASPILIQALHDPSAAVQSCAALALRLNPSQKAIPGLAALLDSPDSLLSKMAGDALIAIGKSATPSMIALIENQGTSHRVKLQAVRVLAHLKDTAAISTLFHIFQEGSSMMQHWAEKGLDDLGIGMVFFDPS